MSITLSPRLLRRVRTAAALMITLFIGSATPITLLGPTPAHAQTCSVNKGGSCQAYQTASISLATTQGSAVTTTDPSEAKSAGQSQSVCDITAPNPTYCGDGVLTPPTNGTATDDLSHGGLVIYTPNPGFVGTDTFVTQTGSLTDGDTRAWVVTTTYTVTVSAPVVAAPTVSNTSITTAYGAPGSVVLPSSGVVSGFSIASTPGHGAATISGSTAIYTPNNGFAGSDSFTFYATGPGGSSSTATVSVTVLPPPFPPGAIPGSASTPFNTPVSVTLGGTGQITSHAITANPGHGTVSLSGSVATYTPQAGYFGADSFAFDVTGPTGTSSPATISITVSPPPAPTASNGAITTAYNTAGSTTLTPTGVITQAIVVGAPAHGIAAVSGSGSTATFSPNPGFIGSDSFTYELIGPGGTSNLATVTVTVLPPAAPSLNNASISTAYDTTGSTGLTSTGVVTSFALVSSPSHGAATLSGSTVIYTPNAGFTGSDSFTVVASGPGGSSNVATVSVAVAPPPAPVASGGAISTAYDTAGSTTLSATGVVSSYAVSGAPSHGTVSISGAVATYTPAAGYYGSDGFTFTASGPGGTSAPATISVTVWTPPAPVAASGTITTPYGTPATVTLPGSGVISSYAIKSGPAHGAVSLSGGSVTYTPVAGYFGPDSFTYAATGPGGTSAPATISVTVLAPPAPTATGGSIATAYNTPASTTLSGSGVISSYAIVSGPSHGTVTLSGGVATYTPQAGYIGADNFTFDAKGPGGTSGLATISVTVEPPPAPMANSGAITCPYQTTCATTLTSTGLGSTYTLATQASNGTCSITGSTLTYVPAWGAVGADSCTFTVSGPGGTSQPATISITNEPPSLPNPGGPTGTPIPTSGASVAICAAGQSASIPGLPGPPTGTVYDPNWCDEQALTIAQQALELQNQQSQITALQSQLAAQQKMVQSLGSDSTSGALAQVNAKAQAILQQAAGIGFNAQTVGSSFAAAYPGGETVAGFNGSQLAAAMQAWRANTAQALQTSVAVQAQVAQSQAGVASAIQGAVNASNGAVGPTAAHQATAQVLAAVTTQLAQLQDLLLAESQAYAALAAAKQQAAGAAAATSAQTQGQTRSAVTSPPGVTDTTHM